MSFEEKILLGVKRTYSKDEAFALLNKELANANFKIGELQSEVSELKHELTKPKEGKTAKEWKQDDFFKELRMQLTKTMEAKRDAQQELNRWRNKYFSLVAKASLKAPHLLSGELIEQKEEPMEG